MGNTLAAVVAIEAAGAQSIYWLTYAPDLNLIDKLFANIKPLILGLRPRSRRDIFQAAK